MGQKVDFKIIRKKSKKNKKRNQTKNSLLNIVIFILLLSSVFFISFVSCIRIKKIHFPQQYQKLNKCMDIISDFWNEKQVEEIIEININSSTKPRVVVYDGNIVQCSKEMIKFYDVSGQLEFEEYRNFNSPILKIADKYLLIADIGGNEAILFKGKEKKWEKGIKGNIINADINKNGYATIINQEERTKGVVTIYNPQGEICFIKGKAEEYIINAKVSQNDKKVLLNCVDTSGVKINSIFEFVDIKGKQLKSSLLHEDVLFSTIDFLKGDSLIAVGGQCIVLYDNNQSEMWKKQLKRKIYSSSICDNKYLVVAMADSEVQNYFVSDKTEIKIFNMKGTEITSLKVDNIVKNISTYNDRIGLNMGKEIEIFTYKGKYIKKINSKMEVEEISFIDQDRLVLTTKNNLTIVN